MMNSGHSLTDTIFGEISVREFLWRSLCVTIKNKFHQIATYYTSTYYKFYLSETIWGSEKFVTKGQLNSGLATNKLLKLSAVQTFTAMLNKSSIISLIY